jgi:hypothetical protein
MIEQTAAATAANFRGVNRSIPSAPDNRRARIKLILAMGITVLACPCSMARRRELTIKNTNTPEISE